MIVPVMANGNGGFDGLVVLLLIGAGSLWLLPVSAAVNWLKGKRIVASIAGALALTLGLGLLVDTEGTSWMDSLVLLSMPLAFAVVVIMFRRARPGSYWYRHWYGSARQEKSAWTFNTREGRRRHKQTLAIVSGSVALGLVAAPLVVAGVNDLLTTTSLETQIELVLYLNGEADSEGLMDLARGDFVVDTQMTSSTAELGPEATTLIRHPLVGGCMFYELTHRVSIMVSPRTDEAVQEVLDRVTPNENLVLAQAEGETLADPLHLTDILDTENFAECERSTVRAFLDPSANDDQRGRLSDEVRGWPEVVAVAEPIWPRERRSFEQYPALVECYGPVDFRVVVQDDSDPLGERLAARLAQESIVERVFPGWDPDAEESEEDVDAFHEHEVDRPGCEDHLVIVHLEIGTTDPDAAVVLAELLRTEGVATADLYRYASDGDGHECADEAGCIVEMQIEAILGDTDAATFSGVAEAICHLPGVIAVNSIKGGPLDPKCTPPRVEVRTKTHEAWESVINFISERGDMFTEIQEQEPLTDDSSAYQVFGDLDPAVCDFQAGDLHFRVESRLVGLDSDEISAVVGQLEEIPGVVDVLGSAVDRMMEDPNLCGHPAIGFAVDREISAAEFNAFVEAVVGQPGVRGLDLVEGPAFHAQFDLDEISAPIGGGGRIYLDDLDVEVARSLVQSLGTPPGVVHLEVIEEFIEQ